MEKLQIYGTSYPELVERPVPEADLVAYAEDYVANFP